VAFPDRQVYEDQRDAHFVLRRIDFARGREVIVSQPRIAPSIHKISEFCGMPLIEYRKALTGDENKSS
jgi:hypothetical protein